jgi:hypothetical protein
LGLTDEQFYALTPRQFHLLLDQHRERTEHTELLAGIIASNIVNWGFQPPKKTAVPADFMPSRMREKPKPKRINRKRIAVNVRAFLEAQRKST